jgi:hypothetical protein
MPSAMSSPAPPRYVVRERVSSDVVKRATKPSMPPALDVNTPALVVPAGKFVDAV